jgi:hypothetical protein
VNAPKLLGETEQGAAAAAEPAKEPSSPPRRTTFEEMSSARRRRRHALTVVVLRALRLYSLIACFDLGVTAIMHPDLLGSPVSGWWPHVRRDVLGALFVLLSGAAWAGLKIIDEPRRGRNDG